jgi:hypothetical protein
MAKMRLPWASLLILLALAAPAPAQTPSAPADTGSASAPAPQAGAAEDGWRDIVERTAERGEWLAGEAWGVASAHDWLPALLVLFNGLLAIFAFRLSKGVGALAAIARAQSADMKQSIAAAQAAADAAKQAAEVAGLQARALVGVELPRLELGSAQLVYADQSVRQALKTPSVEISFTNYGRTSAFVVERCIELRMSPTLPPEPIYRALETAAVAEAVASGQSVGAGAHRRLGDLGESQVQMLLNGGATLWVYGYLRFRDFLGMEHKTGFCLRWAPPPREVSTGGAFVQDGPPSYIYQRERWPAAAAAAPPVLQLREPVAGERLMAAAE